MSVKITIEIDDMEVGKSQKSNLGNDKSSHSIYARFFDETCSQYLPHDPPEHILLYLKQQEAYANSLLKSRGYLFLNDVYGMLGMPRSKAGQVVGWVYDEQNPVGDNFVDFGIYDPSNASFINGITKIALLDFNVDGIILDKIL